MYPLAAHNLEAKLVEVDRSTPTLVPYTADAPNEELVQTSTQSIPSTWAHCCIKGRDYFEMSQKIANHKKK